MSDGRKATWWREFRGAIQKTPSETASAIQLRVPAMGLKKIKRIAAWLHRRGA